MVAGGWTPDTVKQALDAQVEALERLLAAEIKRVDAELHGQERAVELLRLTRDTEQGGARSSQANLIALAAVVVAFAVGWEAAHHSTPAVIVTPASTVTTP